MHARIVWFEGLNTNRYDEIREAIEDEFVPRLREIPGFAGYYALVDRARGKSLALTLWESEEAMRLSEARLAELRDELIGRMGLPPPTAADEYEVAVYSEPGGA